MREPEAMRRWGAFVLAALAVVPGLLGAAGAAPAGGLAVVDDQVIGADPRLHELTLQSSVLGGTTKIRILLPPGYDDPDRAATRYPMLLLLHGVGDEWRSWTEHTDITAFTATTELIIVMPDAGKTPNAGWYSDWVQGPAWESYHVGELVPFIDATYRTIGTREGRAIGGFSMGGFGAMSYAARHPELFVAAASISGAVNTTFAGQGEATAFEILQQSVGTPGDGVWGPYETNETRWRTHNPADLAANLRWTDLWMVSGNGVALPGDRVQAAPTEAGVYLLSLTFHAELDRLAIAHEWHDRGYGTHDWPYREIDFHAWLPHLMGVLATPPSPPAAFDYRSAEPSFEAWGWRFETDRPGLQFVDFTGVSADGFTVAGSGPLGLETPPYFAPNETVRVSADDGTIVDAVADTAGRLQLTVDLGPGQVAPSSPVLGIDLVQVGADPRVRRVVNFERRGPQAAGPADASGSLTGTTLPATGGNGWGATVGLAVLAAALGARAVRRRV